ncbi:hypothetical protein HJC23_006961 [Cyclotella cryptica]|uniref:Secreted protein n=1 Tax=Cyclotella cryptica TaxID=29204 RepID=A0ABD3QNZ9_9STRA|eukprot:CCRYP_004279-RA/>CCRYP_004279-RA protein AED:0.31 eAED:0.31 QI:129/-1/0/1/-1/1/1/0/96
MTFSILISLWPFYASISTASRSNPTHNMEPLRHRIFSEAWQIAGTSSQDPLCLLVCSAADTKNYISYNTTAKQVRDGQPQTAASEDRMTSEWRNLY